MDFRAMPHLLEQIVPIFWRIPSCDSTHYKNLIDGIILASVSVVSSRPGVSFELPRNKRHKD